MCGIAGLWQLTNNSTPSEELGAYAERMAETLAHRGPDDAGAWTDNETGIALSHRRLSIIDLSPEGHQPMQSADGRFVITYNGEIYNYRALQEELCREGASFRGHSDTEVLLTGIDYWGIANMLSRLNGMFVFALWDRLESRLYLVRDRLGQKPLYFGWIGDTFAFASELKALEAAPGFDATLNHEAVALYLRFGCVPAPWSIYDNIHKLEQGQIASLDWQQVKSRDYAKLAFDCYWSAATAAIEGQEQPLQLGDEDATDTLDALLSDATAQRMTADVPVGAFLSGGIDSSLIASLMQAQANQPIKTFALGFEGYDSNETPHARTIAEHLGTEHTEMHISNQEVIDNIPKIPDIVDEPLADPAIIPNYMIAKLTRSHVKVALSGDGGDELFCGYKRMRRNVERWRNQPRIPQAIRQLGTRAVRSWPRPETDRLKLLKTISRLTASSVDELYLETFDQWRLPGHRILNNAPEPATGFGDCAKWPDISDLLTRIQLLELTINFSNTMMTKVDRTSMAAGLEVRSPLLDHRVAEWMFGLPADMKVRDKQGKWILRNLLSRYIPPETYEKPKQGFAAPIQQWLAGPLRNWADDLLAPDRLKRQGLIDPRPIHRLWGPQRRGKRHDGLQNTWHLLMLQSWLNNHGK